MTTAFADSVTRTARPRLLRRLALGRLLLDGLVDEVVGDDGCLEVGDGDLALAAVEIIDHAPPLLAMCALGCGDVLPQVGAPAQVVLGVVEIALADAVGVGAPHRR